jgi:hypothetical protein
VTISWNTGVEGIVFLSFFGRLISSPFDSRGFKFGNLSPPSNLTVLENKGQK